MSVLFIYFTKAWLDNNDAITNPDGSLTYAFPKYLKQLDDDCSQQAQPGNHCTDDEYNRVNYEN